MTLKVKKLDKNACLPVYATPDAAGADLVALIEDEGHTCFAPGETRLLRTGIALEIPQGYVGLVYARSGLASKRGLAPANKVGVIDPDYRGEVMVALHNHSGTVQTISHGERVAQLVIAPVEQATFEEAETLSATRRESGGFGSTGKQ
ncbi:MAG: dUTP diphosphatase [Eubacteriales bacterium]